MIECDFAGLRLIFFNCNLSKKKLHTIIMLYIRFAINQFFKKASDNFIVPKGILFLMLFLCSKIKLKLFKKQREITLFNSYAIWN